MTSRTPAPERPLRTPDLAHLLRCSARRHRERPALIRGDEVRSWGELDARVDALAAALADRGVRQGDAVLLHSPNCFQFVEVMFAVFRIGAVLVPTNFRLTPAEIAAQAQTAGAVACVVHEEFAEHATAVGPVLSAPALTLAIGDSAGFGDDVDALATAYAGRREAQADVRRGDPCWYFFTSGSSGKPKAAVLTHDQLGFVVANHLCDLLPGTTEQDASIVVAPLSHGAGIHLLTQVAAGAVSVLPTSAGLSPEEVWSLVERHAVTNAFTVPTILKLLVEHPACEAHDHRSLRHVVYAGAPMYRRDQALALERLGEVLVQYYGLAEVTGCITVLPAHGHADLAERPDGLGTCGHVRTGMRFSVRDGDGAEAATGERGEIWVCGPGVFAGYLEDPEANAAAFCDGWFRTGDLGFEDDTGALFLTGRASDMYISGGSNIDPRELEEKILEHDAVSEVAVVGVPDATWGEVGVAICVVAPGEHLGEEELLTWMRERIARYKVPKRALVWDELPKSGYGKVTKPLLRDALRARGLLLEVG